MQTENQSNVVPLRRRTWSDANIVLSNKMYWNDQQQCFIILVKRHQWVKALVQRSVAPDPLSRFGKNGDATYTILGDSFLEDLQRKATAAFRAGGQKTAGGWELLYKPPKAMSAEKPI